MSMRLEAPQGTQAVIRAIRLIKAFSPQQPELTLSDLCQAIGLTKTTTHRLLTALESEGLVARNPANGTYHLGPAVIALGSQALLSSDLRGSVRPTLEALSAQTGETATLEVLVGDQMLVLDGIVGRHLVSASLDIGTRWPIHVTSTGKSILAYMDEESRNRLLREPLARFTENTITDPSVFIQELETVREQGYGIAVEELERDYVAVSAEFRGPMGDIEGAVSIGGPASRFTRRRVRSLGMHLRAAADRLSKRHVKHYSDAEESEAVPV
ncbi:MAG: IclR family transcriptional regulator [Acidobacteriota bacterium]|nr:IclR family transcriptional regulator [Acidobacteriota bacterium]